MTEQEHFRRLEAMYDAAPVNRLFRSRLTVSHGHARIEMDIMPDYFHAAGAVHGAAYFKALDDAGFFAVASLVQDVFVLTTGFNIHLTQPISAGKMVAEARWLHGHRRVFLAEGVLYDAAGVEIGRGSGNFMRSRTALATIPAYRDAVID